MHAPLSVSNRSIRRVSLQRQAIASARPGFDKPRLLQLIKQLGYVQVDSIQVATKGTLSDLMRSQMEHARDNVPPERRGSPLYQEAAAIEARALRLQGHGSTSGLLPSSTRPTPCTGKPPPRL